MYNCKQIIIDVVKLEVKMIQNNCSTKRTNQQKLNLNFHKEDYFDP